MKLEEAITYAIMSDGHGKTTDQIAAAINRNGWQQLKDWWNMCFKKSK